MGVMGLLLTLGIACAGPSTPAQTAPTGKPGDTAPPGAAQPTRPATAVVAPAPGGQPGARTRIRVMVYNGAYTSMPVHIANDLGFYAKQGLEAEVVTVNSGPAGVAALLGGSIDFIEPPTDQILENQIKGNDIKLVVGNETKLFYNLMVSTKIDLPRKAQGYPAVMYDLKGLRIGVNALGATTHLMTNVLLKGAGMTPEDVNYQAVGSATTALAAFQAGQVDGVMSFTPFPEIVETLGIGKSALDLSQGEGPPLLQQMGGAFEGFSAKAEYIRNNPRVVDGFIKAHMEAITWMKDPANEARLTEEVKKYVNVAIIPEEKREATIRLMNQNYRRFLGYTVDRKAIDAWNQYAIENKLISYPVPASQVIYENAPEP